MTKVLGAQYSEDEKAITSENFILCPLVWDTGALYGLSLFRDNFIDYEEVETQVQDIAHKIKVVGVGTVMWKLTATNGDTVYLPLLCYRQISDS